MINAMKGGGWSIMRLGGHPRKKGFASKKIKRRQEWRAIEPEVLATRRGGLFWAEIKGDGSARLREPSFQFGSKSAL